jgi:hypothetical protein
MRHFDTPQDHATWKYTLGFSFQHAGPSTQAPRCESACYFTAALIHLLQPINLFISSADQLYGPITTLRHDGHVLKKLPWTAFTLSDADWARVLDAKQILAVSALHLRNITHLTSIRIPTASSIISRLTSTQHYIAHFLHSRSFKAYGKTNLRILVTSYITTR